MSVRHLEHIQQLVEGTDPSFVPTAAVLALPDNLEICEGYNPCEFGTPTGAPRMLGPEYPVIVKDEYTYVYLRLRIDGEVVSTYTKLRDAKDNGKA